MTHVIAEPCITKRSGDCVDVCPVDCIHEVGDQFVIDPKVCIDCRQCVAVCPVEAIFAEEDVPDKWVGFVEKNRKLTEER